MAVNLHTLIHAWQWDPWPLAWKLAEWPEDITVLQEGEVGPCTREVAIQVSPHRDFSVQCALEGPIHVRAYQRARSLPSPRHRPQQGKWEVASSPCGVGAICSFVTVRTALDATAVKVAAGTDITQQVGGVVIKAKQVGSDLANAWSGKKAKSDCVMREQEKRNYPQFQFLEQKYGYFHCRECSTQWESAFTWCVSGTFKVYFKQLCRKCEKSLNPYRVEDIVCSTMTIN